MATRDEGRARVAIEALKNDTGKEAIFVKLDLANMKNSAEAAEEDVKAVLGNLFSLETLHKTICAYLWLTYRLPVAFRDRDAARELKTQTERAISWILDESSKRGYNVGNTASIAYTDRLRRDSNSPVKLFDFSKNSRGRIPQPGVGDAHKSYTRSR